MTKLIARFQRKPLFLFLLPLFFILHNLLENYQASLVPTALELTLIFTAIAAGLAIIFRLFLITWVQAYLLSFYLMAFNFFFGSTHDFLKKNLGGIFFTRYLFIIPALIISVIALIIYFRRTKKDFKTFILFLNCLILLFIAIDTASIPSLTLNYSEVKIADIRKEFTACDTCKKPDIYLIIGDEYAGDQTLRDIFNFDNSPFEKELEQRGFHIIKGTKSNYNATVFSMASLFGMGYIQNLRDSVVSHFDMFACRSIIKKNNFQDFLNKNEYTVYNFSTFDFGNKKNLIRTPFFITKKDYFLAQTFTGRFFARVWFNFVNKKELATWGKIHHENNMKILQAAEGTFLSNTTSPKFVYIHLELPHRPYYFDKNGKETQLEKFGDLARDDQAAYIEYLQYGNKKFLELIDHIKKDSKELPIIMLMSDHGYRQFNDQKPNPYHFINMNAVFMPKGSYSGFTDSLTSVNQLRVLLNIQFNQKLPILKDSVFFIKEPRIVLN